MADRIALLLLPRTLESFILRDQAADLLRSPGVVAVQAPAVPYGVLGRLPRPLRAAVAAAHARALRPPGEPAAAMIFHPFQYPLAEALLARWPGCELWYGLFDHTPAAPDAGPRTRAQLAELHAAAAERAALVFAVSTKLVELERQSGRDAALVPSAADSFPAPEPSDTVIAMALGNLGRRTDWALLRSLAHRMPELTVLLVGRVAEEECRDDEDYRACRSLPGLVWLGRRSDEDAARLMLCADAGLAPFRRDQFNEAGLPNRILKAARLGRRTVAPDFPGLDVWARAVIRCRDENDWVEALRSLRGARTGPDNQLREWALAQTAERQNAPLWERLRELGVAGPRR
jgi:glycosyltransferase involved in cell wall biosynthesis